MFFGTVLSHTNEINATARQCAEHNAVGREVRKQGDGSRRPRCGNWETVAGRRNDALSPAIGVGRRTPHRKSPINVTGNGPVPRSAVSQGSRNTWPTCVKMKLMPRIRVLLFIRRRPSETALRPVDLSRQAGKVQNLAYIIRTNSRTPTINTPFWFAKNGTYCIHATSSNDQWIGLFE